ncbi:hypothetical protein V2J52_16750 [Georgenia sp. MJ173]|uniref:hypothetical protein n=1 Tax=Georgenia sunbinii TaxID=3117728 RepID=UPI002F269928
MVEETDGIEEAFEGQVRVLVTAAGQIAERLARGREQALRRVQAHSEQETREMHSRLEAEHRAARAELGGVYRAEWWDRATPEQIGHAYQVARAWAHEDPEAVRAEQRIRDELRTRYGIDADNTGATPAAVNAAMQRAEHERAQADAERNREQVDRAEAHRLLRDADHEERLSEEASAAAHHEPHPDERLRAAVDAELREAAADHLRADGRAMYDSAERRQSIAHELEAKGIDQKVVATKIRADVSQSRPATEAVKRVGGVPKARSARVRGMQRHRAGLDR